MKKTTVLLLLTLSCFFFACRKKTFPPPEITLSAVVDGFQWVSSGTYISFDKRPALHVAIGADSASSHIKLEIGNYTGVGTYILADSGNTATYINSYPGTGSVTHKATSGQIVITSDVSANNGPTTIKGTFQFLADTISVQNGSFTEYLNLN